MTDTTPSDEREAFPGGPRMGSALQKLGERLADMLDDDQWNNIQPMLMDVHAWQARAASQPAQEPVTWPKGLRDRLRAAHERFINGHAPRRIPADPTDADLVLAEVRNLLDGDEPPFWVAGLPREPLYAAPPATQQAEPVALEHLCGVLPAETYWGDPITPDVVRHILSVGPPYAAPPAVQQQVEPVGEKRIANAIHYPACWDTAAYPELDDALAELFQAFRCQECAPADDEAVRLLGDAKLCFADRGESTERMMVARIDAYLAKAK